MKQLQLPNRLFVTVTLTGIFTSIHSFAASVALLPSESFRFGTIVPHDPSFLSVYNVGSDNNIQHSIIRFDFSSIPNGATIDSATLTLTCFPFGYSQASGMQSDIYAVAVPWDSMADWFYSYASVPWSTAGGDVTGSSYATNNSVIFDSVGNKATWDVSNLVSIWTAGNLPNYGMLLKGSDGNGLHFFSTVAPGYGYSEIDPSYLPQMTVTYSIPEPSYVMLYAIALFGIIYKRQRSN